MSCMYAYKNKVYLFLSQNHGFYKSTDTFDFGVLYRMDVYPFPVTKSTRSLLETKNCWYG